MCVCARAGRLHYSFVEDKFASVADMLCTLLRLVPLSPLDRLLAAKDPGLLDSTRLVYHLGEAADAAFELRVRSSAP